VQVGEGLVSAIEAHQAESGFNDLGLDQSHLTVDAYQRINLALGAKATVTAEDDPCHVLRRIKDEWEISQMELAASIADEALGLLVPKIKPGATERELALAFYNLAHRSGGEGIAFETIVAAGPQGALPHARPSEYRLREGDFVTIDYGAVVNGYRSDATRTFVLGKPDALQTERYNAVLAAQEKALAAIKPGASTRDIDGLARDHLAGVGYGDYFGHGLGHSLGLAIHEEPRFSPIAPEVFLESGMVMTVEPGIYIPGWGGVRIENSVLVTAGSMKSLTVFPKTLEEMTII
jgi:Xaa-Pro aminopeptidase